MNDSSKKHHYIPQSILRRFSSDTEQTQVYVFDKIRMKSFRSSIRDAGCENYFNAVKVEGQTVSLEGLFQINDDQLARLLEVIVSNRSLAVLTSQDRMALSEVTAAQIVRTKLLRTTIRSIAEQLSKSIEDAGIAPTEIDGFSVPTEQEIRRAALASFLDLRGIIAALQKKRPILIHSSHSMPFWTSDNPVVLHNSFPYGEQGLKSPGIEIYLPISSELVLGLFCPSIELKIRQFLSIGHPSVEREKYTNIYRAFHDGYPIPADSETHLLLNSLQVLRSSRFLYAPNDDFEQARKLIDQHPVAQDVQSLVSVGSMGQGPPPHLNMPPGLWAIFYGKQSHHMIKVETWDEDSEFLDFQTYDLLALRSILNDQPLEQVILFENGEERRGMREIQIKVMEEDVPICVRITHRDEALNQILRTV